MRFKTILFSLLLTSGVVAGCHIEQASETTENQDADAERGRQALGKADLTGSCKAITHNDEGWLVEKLYCGGKSYAKCWCDSKCAEYGDCCSDYKDSCDAGPPPSDKCQEGELECPGCCNTTFCVEDVGAACPLMMCPGFCPPPSCEQLGGECLSSEIDVTFPAKCADLGRIELDGTCGAINQACCGDDAPPPPPPPAASCVGNCGKAAADKACYCDNLCVEYGDCCEDYKPVCTL